MHLLCHSLRQLGHTCLFRADELLVLRLLVLCARDDFIRWNEQSVCGLGMALHDLLMVYFLALTRVGWFGLDILLG